MASASASTGDANQLGPWRDVLAHRTDSREAAEVRERFIVHGVSPEAVMAALQDGGTQLAAAAASGRPDWSAPFGGLLAAALLAAEVSAHASHLVERASVVRSVAVDGLLDDFSAIAVASELGVSRQKVYEIARNSVQRRGKLPAMLRTPDVGARL